MTVLVAGLVVFLGIHSFAMLAPALHDRLAARLGEAAFKGLYSLVAIAGFVLIVEGFGAARAASPVLYVSPAWLKHLAVALLAPVFPLALAAYLPGRIQTTVRHPLLAATKAWAFAHLLANGTLADLLLFGGLLAWAIADRISLKRRPPRAIRMAPSTPWNDVAAVVFGLAIYGALIAGLHLRLFGVAPLG